MAAALFTGVGTVKKIFQDMKILKFQDIFRDRKPRKYAENVPIKSSKINQSINLSIDQSIN